MPFDVPEVGAIPEPAKLPREIPKIVTEHPPLEGRFFEREQKLWNPHQYASRILATASDRPFSAQTMAGDFSNRLKKEEIVGNDVNESDVQNALRHFLAAYSITQEFGSPKLTWDLGAFNELIVSPFMSRWKGESKKRHERDTEIDYYHNRLGIEEAVKHSGKDVPLYELVRRLVKEGKFRY